MATKQKKKERKKERKRRQRDTPVKSIPLDTAIAGDPSLESKPLQQHHQMIEEYMEEETAQLQGNQPLTKIRAPSIWNRALTETLKRTAVLHGNFTLASGKKSNFYIDCKKALLGPSLKMAVTVVMDVMAYCKLHAIAGPTIGADPIVAGAVLQGHPFVSGGLVRSSTKDHGTLKLIEGNLPRGGDVLLVEDVTTTGSSMLKAAETLNEHGIRTPYAFALVDRGVDPAVFSAKGIKFIYGCQVDELL